MTVTVLMPVFNTAAYLPSALDSVLGQSVEDIEVILVDNHSTDRTWEIAQEYARRDQRIQVSRHDMNRGAVANSNHCLSLARTPWAMFMCGDDLMVPEALARLQRATDLVADAVMAYGRYEAFVETPPVLQASRGEVVVEKRRWPDGLADLLSGGNPVPFSTCLFRTEEARKVGGLDSRRQYSADYALWLALAGQGPVARIEDVTLHYRLHDSSDSARQGRHARRSLLEMHAAKAHACASMSEVQWRAYCCGRRRDALAVLGRAAARSIQGWTTESQVARETLRNALSAAWRVVRPGGMEE